MVVAVSVSAHVLVTMLSSGCIRSAGDTSRTGTGTVIVTVCALVARLVNLAYAIESLG